MRGYGQHSEEDLAPVTTTANNNVVSTVVGVPNDGFVRPSAGHNRSSKRGYGKNSEEELSSKITTTTVGGVAVSTVVGAPNNESGGGKPCASASDYRTLRRHGNHSDEDLTPQTTTVNGNVVSTAVGVPSNESGGVKTVAAASDYRTMRIHGNHSEVDLSPQTTTVNGKVVSTAVGGASSESAGRIFDTADHYRTMRCFGNDSEVDSSPQTTTVNGMVVSTTVGSSNSSGATQSSPLNRNMTLGRTKREDQAFAMSTPAGNRRRASMPNTGLNIRPSMAPTLPPQHALSSDTLNESIHEIQSIQLESEKVFSSKKKGATEHGGGHSRTLPRGQRISQYPSSRGGKETKDQWEDGEAYQASRRHKHDTIAGTVRDGTREHDQFPDSSHRYPEEDVEKEFAMDRRHFEQNDHKRTTLSRRGCPQHRIHDQRTAEQQSEPFRYPTDQHEYPTYVRSRGQPEPSYQEDYNEAYYESDSVRHGKRNQYGQPRSSSSGSGHGDYYDGHGNGRRTSHERMYDRRHSGGRDDDDYREIDSGRVHGNAHDFEAGRFDGRGVAVSNNQRGRHYEQGRTSSDEHTHNPSATLSRRRGSEDRRGNDGGEYGNIGRFDHSGNSSQSSFGERSSHSSVGDRRAQADTHLRNGRNDERGGYDSDAIDYRGFNGNQKPLTQEYTAESGGGYDPRFQSTPRNPASKRETKVPKHDIQDYRVVERTRGRA
ncbi:hypothetical protein BJ742DRAFT_371288 [Cladochytrium replicatum]|nr:hypothetical protein BJ742DRAFT_371288 [Cladochytrium replicatum]